MLKTNQQIEIISLKQNFKYVLNQCKQNMARSLITWSRTLSSVSCLSLYNWHLNSLEMPNLKHCKQKNRKIKIWLKLWLLTYKISFVIFIFPFSCTIVRQSHYHNSHQKEGIYMFIDVCHHRTKLYKWCISIMNIKLQSLCNLTTFNLSYSSLQINRPIISTQVYS